MKQRVAIWTHGGIAAGVHAEGVPALESTVLGLAANHELTLYVAEPPRKALPQLRVRHIGYMRHFFAMPLLALLFLWDHWRRPYALIHAFYGLPSGRLACWLGKQLKIPVLVTFMGAEAANLPDIGYGHLREDKPERAQIRRIVREASAIVCLTEFQKQALCRELRIQGEEMVVIPFSVDQERFRHPDGYREAKQAGEKVRLIHIASQNMVKDQATLLHALALLSQDTSAELHMLGGDHLRGAIPTMAAEMGLGQYIHFAGDLPYDAVALALQESDILVHSSLYEGQGLIYMEAMATGTPIVSTNVGLAADLPEACITRVEAGDAVAMAAAIRDLWHDPERRKAQSDAAYTWYQQHTLRHTLSAYGQLYDRLCNRS